MVLKDFNIQDEAGGAGKPIIKSFDANITGGTLEIHLYWAGRGIVAMPSTGGYGPLISAISAMNRRMQYSKIFHELFSKLLLFVSKANTNCT